MNDWDKSRTKTFIELAGAGAVLLGLIFVGLELRQNTAAVEAATMQNVTDASVQWITNIASDPELTRIFGTDPSRLDELTDTDYRRLHLLFRAQWFRFQNAFRQWQRGTLDEADWRIYEGFICRVEAPGILSMSAANIRVLTWGEHKDVLLDEFAEFVENCRAEYSL